MRWTNRNAMIDAVVKMWDKCLSYSYGSPEHTASFRFSGDACQNTRILRMDVNNSGDLEPTEVRDSPLDFFSPEFDAAVALSTKGLQPPNPKACSFMSH